MPDETPYTCAGWDRKGAMRYVDAEEARRAGIAGHPWSLEMKAAAVEGLNGSADELDIDKRIKAIADKHHDAALMDAKRARAGARA